MYAYPSLPKLNFQPKQLGKQNGISNSWYHKFYAAKAWIQRTIFMTVQTLHACKVALSLGAYWFFSYPHLYFKSLCELDCTEVGGERCSRGSVSSDQTAQCNFYVKVSWDFLLVPTWVKSFVFSIIKLSKHFNSNMIFSKVEKMRWCGWSN